MDHSLIDRPEAICAGGATHTPAHGETDALLRWLWASGVGPGRLRALREVFGSAQHALGESAERVSAALRVTNAEAARMLSEALAADPQRERELAHSRGARIVALHDDTYPQLLRASVDPPALLFVRGELAAAPEVSVALVGSRKASAYGRIQAGRLSVALAEHAVTIVSGGARGIDAEAHRAALRANGRTIAVLAAGVPHPYPPEHADLFDAIVNAGGAVVTEQVSRVEPRAELFPRRNRIVAGLSLGVVVVEAAMRSGALLTARIAVDDLSRDVGCVPGSVDSPLSAGCHRAIREGWARLITSADDVCEMLSEASSLAQGAVEHAARDPSLARSAERESTAALRALSAGVDRAARVASARSDGGANHSDAECSADGRTVLAAIRARKSAGLDELEVELGWHVGRIAAATLELEVRRRIERDQEGAFRCRAHA